MRIDKILTLLLISHQVFRNLLYDNHRLPERVTGEPYNWQGNTEFSGPLGTLVPVAEGDGLGQGSHERISARDCAAQTMAGKVIGLP